jgi:enediyne biosynthesis protein E4
MGCWAAPPAGSGSGDLVWTDQSETVGLVQPLTGMHGHAAIWTDINADGLADLYVGTFADRDVEIYQQRGAQGPSPDRLLVNQGGNFVVDVALPDMFSRTSGGVGVDLDGDADLDLVASRNFRDAGAPPTQILENDGGALTPVTDSGIPEDLGGRSVGVLDYDLDGDYDLFITEDRWSGGSSRLLRNEGGLRFSDATGESGIPADVDGLAVAVSDLSADGHPDIFVAGSNRLFVATGDGSFVEADSSQFAWEIFSEEDDVAGVSAADVNRDGLIDLALGQHYNSTVEDGLSVPVRLYLNRGLDAAGMPMFEDVTEAAGLIPLPTKAPHVELNDLNNDGWPDLVTTASSSEGAMPAVFLSQGLDGDVPVFSAPEGLGSKQYWVAGPSADYDRDGRLDLFLVEWEPSLPSLLLRNESEAGHWLEVSVDGTNGHGIGWLIEVYEGDGTDPGGLLGAREITVTQGYSAGVLPIAHFGLGEATEVTVQLTPPGGADAILLEGVAADQHIRYPGGCGN